MARDVVDHFAIASRAAEIDAARGWASAHLAGAGASADLLWEVELALTEALSNVIRHGYGEDETGRIELALRLDDERVELEIVHFGEPFDPESYREPDLDAAPAGGYGVGLIAELMDEVEQTKAPGHRTCLRLLKRR